MHRVLPMALELQYDQINWNDPELIAALTKYRETIDAASPIMTGIKQTFSTEEIEARQKAFFQVLEKYKVDTAT